MQPPFSQAKRWHSFKFNIHCLTSTIYRNNLVGHIIANLWTPDYLTKGTDMNKYILTTLLRPDKTKSLFIIPAQ